MLVNVSKFVTLHRNSRTDANLMDTKKQRLELEYPLNARKPDILWSMMSTDHGLERWIADRVNERDGILELTWGDLLHASCNV